MVKVIWTDLAIADLRSIHEYIAQDSKTYADSFIEKILQRVDQLESFPQSGRIVPEFNKETLRELILGNYRIVYRVQNEFVGIVRVHHNAQNLTEEAII
jgi:toxin ParE1/3/4